MKRSKHAKPPRMKGSQMVCPSESHKGRQRCVKPPLA